MPLTHILLPSVESLKKHLREKKKKKSMGKRKERKVDITSPTYLFIPFLNMFSICGNRKKKKDSCDYLIKKKKCERFTNCGITTPGDSDYMPSCVYV